MRAAARAARLFLAAGLGLAAPSAFAADAVTITGAGHDAAMSVEDLSRLPQTEVTLPFTAEAGHAPEVFSGPLLWTVLARADAVDASKPRGQVRLVVTVTGRDGYSAVLALAEIAPDFAGKTVILADRLDGKPMATPRLVVPGDHRAGRSVRDVAHVSVGPS